MSAPARTPLQEALPGLMTCVHCGFCLPSCPTYGALGDENDSPRGRILLMRAAAAGALPLDDESLVTHLDRCLGCRACETVCPSGVPYGAALEGARATMAPARRAPLAERLLLWAIGHPAVLRAVLAAARALRATGIPRRLARRSFPAAMLAASAPAIEPAADAPPAASGVRGTVAILRGCVMDGLFAHVHRASARALGAAAFRVVPEGEPGCCGALHAHAGREEEARAMARARIASFERCGADFVAVDAAGCGAMMKEYGRLLAHDPAWRERAERFAARVRDVTELLGGGAAGPSRMDVRVAYDAPCHLHHAQRVREAPLAVLASVPGLTLVPLEGADRCCGSAGSYNLTQAELAAAVLAPKLDAIAAARVDLVATGNPGCQMQIGAGLLRSGSGVRVVHPVELLAASHGGAPPATASNLGA